MLALIDSALQKAHEILGSECSPIGMNGVMGVQANRWATRTRARSAGMYAFAYHCVEEGRVSILTLER